jgi:hypothetical protein
MKPTLRTVTSAALALWLSLASFAVEAQQAGKVYQIGWLTGGSATSAPHLPAAIFQALEDRGRVQGKNLPLTTATPRADSTCCRR